MIPANGQIILGGGMPLDKNLIGIGISVTGTNDAGEEFTFHSYLPLLQEIRED